MNEDLLQLLVYGRTCPEIVLKMDISPNGNGEGYKYTLKKGKRAYILSHYSIVFKEEEEFEYKLLRESPITLDVAIKLLSMK